MDEKVLSDKIEIDESYFRRMSGGRGMGFFG